MKLLGGFVRPTASHLYNSTRVTDLQEIFHLEHLLTLKFNPVYNQYFWILLDFAESMKHIGPQTNRQPIKLLQAMINLCRSRLIGIQRPTWWTSQGRLSEICSVNAFGDKERDPSHATGHNIENYCCSSIKIAHYMKSHWCWKTEQQLNLRGWQNETYQVHTETNQLGQQKRVAFAKISKIRIWINRKNLVQHLKEACRHIRSVQV